MKVYVNGELKDLRVLPLKDKGLRELDLGDEVELLDLTDKNAAMKARIIGVDNESIFCKVGKA